MKRVAIACLCIATMSAPVSADDVCLPLFSSMAAPKSSKPAESPLLSRIAKPDGSGKLEMMMSRMQVAMIKLKQSAALSENRLVNSKRVF